MINQVNGAVPRTLKEVLLEGEAIRFAPEEVRRLAASMVNHLTTLTTTVGTTVERWAVTKKYVGSSSSSPQFEASGYSPRP